MATPQNSGASAPLHVKITPDSFAVSPLTGFARGIFSSYTWNDVCEDAVPCVRFENGEVLSYWSTPDFSKYPDPLQAAADFGHRSAAAVVVFTQRFGCIAGVTPKDVLTDPAFIAALAGNEEESPHAARCFLHQIERYLWALGQNFSPAQLVADAESAIAEQHYLTAEEQADLAQRSVQLSNKVAA